ncbi:pentatricopeptide repeat-containing protein At4g04370-like [Pyrus communis]|uniref:pentatricopeptide repeat-containing protein At4g04370-like n=1 Tax=Pyrus communis TaxID=23211 RepID=UPI0035BFA566
MPKTNTLPDTYTFPNLLKACTSLNLFLYGLSFHQCSVVNGFSLDAYVTSSLINFYAKFGHAQNARKVFDVMPHRNVVPWTSIIGCYSRAGNAGIAFEMFSEMRREEVQPSSVTLVSLISGVSELAYLQCSHGCAVLYGFESDLTLVNSMLNAYGKCGRVEDARDLFEYMNARDVVSWNSLISSYSQAGNIGEVFRLLYTMRVEEMEPDKQTYASAVSVAATQSNLKLGKSVHGQILRTGYEFDSHVETALMVMYLKCRNIDLAFHIFEGTTNKDVVLWTAMMSGLVHNEVSKLEEILMLRPGDAGNYVQLAHSYALMNRWDCLGKAWSQMRSLSLKKLPGWSSIKLHGRITTFFTDHNTNPQFDDIVSTLNMLTRVE